MCPPPSPEALRLLRVATMYASAPPAAACRLIPCRPAARCRSFLLLPFQGRSRAAVFTRGSRRTDVASAVSRPPIFHLETFACRCPMVCIRPTWFAQPLGHTPVWSSPAYSAALAASCASALAAHRLCMPVFCLPAASSTCVGALTGKVFRSLLVFELPQPVLPCGSTVLWSLNGPKTVLTWLSYPSSLPPTCAGGWI